MRCHSCLVYHFGAKKCKTCLRCGSTELAQQSPGKICLFLTWPNWNVTKQLGQGVLFLWFSDCWWSVFLWATYLGANRRLRILQKVPNSGSPLVNLRHQEVPFFLFKSLHCVKSRAQFYESFFLFVKFPVLIPATGLYVLLRDPPEVKLFLDGGAAQIVRKMQLICSVIIQNVLENLWIPIEQILATRRVKERPILSELSKKGIWNLIESASPGQEHGAADIDGEPLCFRGVLQSSVLVSCWRFLAVVSWAVRHVTHANPLHPAVHSPCSGNTERTTGHCIHNSEVILFLFPGCIKHLQQRNYCETGRGWHFRSFWSFSTAFCVKYKRSTSSQGLWVLFFIVLPPGWVRCGIVENNPAHWNQKLWKKYLGVSSAWQIHQHRKSIQLEFQISLLSFILLWHLPTFLENPRKKSLLSHMAAERTKYLIYGSIFIRGGTGEFWCVKNIQQRKNAWNCFPS